MLTFAHSNQNTQNVLSSINDMLAKREFRINTIKYNSITNVFEICCIKRKSQKRGFQNLPIFSRKKFFYLIENLLKIKNVIGYEMEYCKKSNYNDLLKLSYCEVENVLDINVSRDLKIHLHVSKLDIEISPPEFINIEKNVSRIIDPFRLSPSRGHYNLTRSPMKKAGFSRMDIETAYESNMSVDRFINRIDKSFHYMPGTKFQAEKIIEEALQRAINYELDGNHHSAMKALGEGMHTLQDKYSHHDQNAGWIHHLPFGNDPDNPEKHQEEFLDAHRATKRYIEKYLSELSSRKKQANELYTEINFLIAIKDAYSTTE